MESNNLMNRRELVGLGITAGFALAVCPVTGLAVTTSEEGLHTESGKVGEMPIYHARPKSGGPFPVVIVVHEIFGVHAYIQDVCRRLAKVGYLAVAPYLYYRQGDVSQITDIAKIVSDMVAKTPQSQVLKDLDSLFEWTKGQKAADSRRVGLTGFCWGGNVTWMYASHNPILKAGVAWYGRLVQPADRPKEKYPTDIAADLKVPVLGLYGGKDKGIPVADVEKMRAALKGGKSPSEIVVYPEAEHAFHADYRPSYHPQSAQDGWKKLLSWFKKHGL